MLVSNLADLLELRALLASFPRLPTDLRAGAAYARAAKYVFETCGRLVQLIAALGTRPSAN